MREWEERMRAAGAVFAGDEGIIANGALDEEWITKLKEAGKGLSALA